MRTPRMLAAVAATMVGLIGVPVLAPAPAYAGNWAVTVLDPLPDRLESGKGYTIGLWVLQHGFHPYEGDLGTVALRLVDEQGASVSFPAVVLPEPAHYAAAVAVPRPGAWTVIGVQGRFADYRIGTLTVPGTLSVFGVPAPLQSAQTEKYWPGAIRPPAVPVDTDRDPFATVVDPVPLDNGPAPAVEPAARSSAAPPAPTSRRAVLVGVVLLAVAVVALGSVTGYRRLRTRGAGGAGGAATG
ncbi:hypothetical protein I0C86_36645 [Plantactinospora sp. S1510]|uniref:Uncharacterized protein n=1 Tax=Plantactinospora alkalitolerans TaxID=2789879 RepID=A0ABS0H7H8_9ACTN|nr:hypothetical protein [Plantactinospora alkalitolerans]MBF9134419.1 hypothetical protein [Plantactinospora alkalitolerans]